MAAVLVAQIQLVVFLHKAQIEDAYRQRFVTAPGSTLALVGLELFDGNTQRYACLAAAAIGPIGKHTAASEAIRYQL